MAYIGKQPVVGNFQVCDAISVVNGQAAYTMQVGSTNVEPENANHMLVSLNGVLQKPGSSFTISGSTITFASNLATGDVIDFIILLGDTLNVGTPSDDSVGAAQIKNDLISGTTALTSAPDDTDELLISDAGTLKRIDVSLIGGQNTPAFYATGTTQTNVSTDTYTKAQFDSEEFDTAGDYDHSTNYRFTPTTAGKYFIFTSIRFFDDTDTDVIRATELQIFKNGTYHSPPIRAQSRLSNSDADYFNVHNSENIGAIVEANGSSDYFEVHWHVKHTGSNVDVIPNFFGAYKLIGV